MIMKINTQNTHQTNQPQNKNWVGESKIPMPGSDGVSFKDLVAVKTEMQNLKIGVVQKK
jgi:hypothetical protein